MKILGIHASFNSKTHDPSVALLDTFTGFQFASEEERYLRYKTSSGRFPEYSLVKCLESCDITIDDIDYVAVDGVQAADHGQKVTRYIKDIYGSCPPVTLISHPESHIYGAWYFTGCADCLAVSIDGYGDNVSILIYKFCSGLPTKVYEAGPESSLGDFYTAFTNYLGFKSIEGEYKVMGMAAYSKYPIGTLRQWIGFNHETEQIFLESSIFDRLNYTSIYEPLYNRDFIYNKTGIAPRGNNDISQEHFDLAGEVQHAFEETYINLISHFLKKTDSSHLVLSGGCALNVLANMKLSKRLGDVKIDIFPAASDRGLSLGSAVKCAFDLGSLDSSSNKGYFSFSLGSCYKEPQIKLVLDSSGYYYKRLPFDLENFILSRILLDGYVIAWFKGRSEFGPRALGFRSILGYAGIAGMKDKINMKIKFRESYRPFAPAILEDDYLSLKLGSPNHYMTCATDVHMHMNLFGETMHADGSARVQCIDSERSPYMFNLLHAMRDLVMSPVCLINTSFNLAGEPIVESPKDAIRTFASSDIDFLSIGPFIVAKESTKSALLSYLNNIIL